MSETNPRQRGNAGVVIAIVVATFLLLSCGCIAVIFSVALIGRDEEMMFEDVGRELEENHRMNERPLDPAEDRNGHSDTPEDESGVAQPLEVDGG